MTQSGYLFLGLTAIVAALVSLLVFAVLRFAAAAHAVRRSAWDNGAETAFMAAALQDAMAKLRDQERAMHARAEASERLSDEIIASLTSGLLVVGRDGDVRTVNPAGRRLLGLPESLAGRPVKDLLAGAPPLAEAIHECLQTRRPIVRRALRLSRRTPEDASHLGVTVSPNIDDHGELQGAICLFSDLTGVIALEDRLRLKDGLARLGELTAGIAHEFRNGLATIHGYSRLLDLERLPAEFRPYVEGIRSETETLGEIVTNFLNFARPAPLTLGPVSLQAIADRAAEEIRMDVQQSGGTVVVRGQFAMVEGDEVLLRQAFSNLCRNAFEACSEAGVAPAIVLEGSIDAEQQVARVAVIDNGPGLTALAGDQIFTPFFTTKAKGTGLGLPLVQKIVVTHNGRIVAGAAPDGGARFEVILPLSADLAATSQV